MGPALRRRLFDAILVGIDKRGYEALDLPGIARSFGLSHEQMAAEHADKDAWLSAAYEGLAERLRDAALQGCDPDRPWPQRVHGGLAAVLAELAAEPPLARVLIRSLPASGPAARERYEAFLRELAGLLADGRAAAALGTELPDEVELLALGAAEAIVLEVVEDGRIEALPALAPAILFSLLVPFLGPEQAAAEMRRAQRRGGRPANGEADLDLV